MPKPFTAACLAGACLMAVVLAIAGCNGHSSPAAPSPTAFPALALQRAFPALTFSSPVAMLQAPGDSSRWYVVERGGRVVVFPNDSQVTPAQVAQVIKVTVDTAGEGGLLGMAFHPDFPGTPQIFLSYTRTGPDAQHPLTSVIARFATSDGGATLDPTSAREILTLDQPYANHDGGNIAFDRAGHLFIGFGDGGSANDPQNNGQNVNTLLGKMLRIDVNGTPAAGKAYAIPGDNPFAAGGGAPEIYAYGLRNPWRWSFDRNDGRLWVADVGQGSWEEVDIVTRGGNYGWSVCEGAHLRGSSTPCANPAYIDPIAEYDHSQGCSITGGYVYRGQKIPGLAGVYLFGDYCSGTLWGLRETNAGAPVVQPAIKSGIAVVSFGEANDGELYVVDLGGTLQRVIAAP
jgi:glucose/arabinose dehydrogenase